MQVSDHSSDGRASTRSDRSSFPGGWYPLTSAFGPPQQQTSALHHASTGQLAPSPAPAPVATPSPAPSAISIGPNGRINGVDGMLDQIAQALTRHAGPMLVRDVLPAVQQDHASQARVGRAAGAAMADNLRPWIIVGVGALGVLAAVEVLKYARDQRSGAARRAGR